jgi:uncharacterized protein YjbI with pentapeptide repeats
MSGANLSGANLDSAILTKANLSRANLSEANLSKAILKKSTLSWAILTKANLYRAEFERSSCSASVLIQPQNYEGIFLDKKTNFKYAICDNRDFIYHVSRFTEAIPTIVNNKRELRSKLKENGIDEPMIESILEISDLPETN